MDKLKIRKMDIRDTDALYALLSNVKVMEYLEPPFSREQTVQFLQEHGLSDSPRIFSVDNEEGHFIGYVIFHRFDESSVEIGWVLTPEVWGKGYAEQLTVELVKKAQECEKDAVIECSPDQKVSKKIAVKCGFDYQGQIDGLDLYRRDHTVSLRNL